MPWKNRLELQARLQEVSGYPEEQVLYQPPTGTKLKYPCIIYDSRQGDIEHADNNPYVFYPFYEVTHIYLDADSGLETTKKLCSKLQGARYDRAWTVDNLYHENIITW